MISNRHIRRDYLTFLNRPFPNKSTALCGKRVRHKYIGVPGVTKQDFKVFTSSGLRGGWCEECSHLALREIDEILKNNEYPCELHGLYNKAAEELGATLMIWMAA